MAVVKKPAARLGRPRRFEPDDERAMLMNAALRVISRTGYTTMTVSEVLGEAGLSTSAFYRHFDSNSALLHAVQEHEMATVEQLLDRVVAEASDPVTAVDAWLEQFLSFYYPPWRDVLVPLFFSAAVNARYRDRARVMSQMRKRFCRPLVRSLRDGAAMGVLTSAAPHADAHCIHGLVNAVVVSDTGKLPDRAKALAQIRRFTRPALGLPVSAAAQARSAASRPARPA